MTNDTPIESLLDRLIPDEWREKAPYAGSFGDCHSALLDAPSDERRAALLGAWLARHQPCLFGRQAARLGRIEYCFLTDTDLFKGDEHVAGKIALARLRWRRRGLKGESSAFVIHAVSSLLSNAEPNENLLAVAQRIAELYLLREVPPDVIRHDEIFLESEMGNLRWRVGVNYFGAQAEGRWWKDHRVPGGIALSMNSVGHLACANRLEKHSPINDQRYGLDAALTVAMQLLNTTVPNLAGARNTWLHETKDRPEPADIRCPVSLPKALEGKNRCEYGGLYHTDQTLPSAYFSAAQHRPDGPTIDNLDLTYLHHDSPENPDYRRMGIGKLELT